MEASQNRRGMSFWRQAYLTTVNPASSMTIGKYKNGLQLSRAYSNVPFHALKIDSIIDMDMGIKVLSR